MQLLTKLTLAAVVLTAIGTSATFADDQRLENRLAADQAQNSPRVEQTTVAVYANHHSVGRADATTADNGQQYVIRLNGHSTPIGVWIDARVGDRRAKYLQAPNRSFPSERLGRYFNWVIEDFANRCGHLPTRDRKRAWSKPEFSEVKTPIH